MGVPGACRRRRRPGEGRLRSPRRRRRREEREAKETEEGVEAKAIQVAHSAVAVELEWPVLLVDLCC